jgi:RNA polymerase sigma factor (TIGR02999 family)
MRAGKSHCIGHRQGFQNLDIWSNHNWKLLQSRVMAEVTQIIEQIQQGNPGAAERLLPLIYDELRRLAAQKLACEKPGQTLDPTSLVHEAYLRLVPGTAGAADGQQWDNRGHFFSAAAEAMRRILVEQARRKARLKRGGHFQRVELDGLDVEWPDESSDELLALDEVLQRLAVDHPDKVAVVKLRYFAGLTIDQVAAALDVSPATVDRHWAYARAWLHRELGGRTT